MSPTPQAIYWSEVAGLVVSTMKALLEVGGLCSGIGLLLFVATLMIERHDPASEAGHDDVHRKAWRPEGPRPRRIRLPSHPGSARLGPR